ncbi:MAG: SAM-dependent methyltransferase, partial [Dissulfurimicrobium sp.]
MDTRRAVGFLDCILKESPPFACKVRLWDGTELSFGEGSHQFVLHIKQPDIIDSIFTGDPSLAFGNAYVNGDIDIEGDLGALLSLVYRTGIQSKLSFSQKARICWAGIKNKARDGIRQSKIDVQAHYDKGNDFYKLWLDDGLNYSCAIFSSPGDTLEEAQRRKIAYTLHKLRLSTGQRLLDIGCGWGSLAIYAAKIYGCSVVGITLSEQQYALAKKKVEEQGLSGQVNIRLEDYRELETSPFDRIVSVGMFEHVG